MDSLTIYDAMKRALPPVASRNVQYQPISASSSSTKLKDPIRVLIVNDAENLLKPASEALENLPITSACRMTAMPRLEKSHYLRTEADVLRVSALQLIHPINLVLEGLLPSGAQFRCLSEVVTQNGKARTDLKWTYTVAGEPITVAILEYKNTNVIRKSDFSPAFTTEEGKKDAIAKSRRDRYEEGTLLEENAIVLSKQTNKYSKGCKDIALFDWHSMCVFDFNDNGDRDAVGFTHSSEPEIFRLLLFGMILKGLARNGLVS